MEIEPAETNSRFGSGCQTESRPHTYGAEAGALIRACLTSVVVVLGERRKVEEGEMRVHC